jgi:DNA end-binding protein Ku
VHPVGERAGAGHPAVEQHDLAVEQHVRGQARHVGQLGEVRGDVAAAAPAQRQHAGVDVGEHPHAVPLHLVEPLRSGRERSRGGEHGLHAVMLAPMRAMWSGAVSFGLVSVPIKLYSATTNHDIRFHQVHGADGGRIKYKRTCALDGEEVDYADIVKGYETEDGELITLSDEDLDALPTASGHEIDVIEFVPADQIDPLLFDKSYYLEPEAKAAKPYALLREALVDTDRMAVVKVALRQRESIALLRVRGKAIVLQTMLWPDEVRDPSSTSSTRTSSCARRSCRWRRRSSRASAPTSTRRRSTTSTATPVAAMIERKRETGEARPAPVAEKGDEGGDSMTDLLTALQRSVEAARAGRDAPAEEPAPPPRRSRPRRSPRPGGRRRPPPTRTPPASAPASPPDRPHGPSASCGGVSSAARASNRAMARSRSQFTTPSRTGTVVVIPPSPTPRMAKPNCARCQTCVPSSTVMALDRPVARGTSRNGLSSTAGLVTRLSSAEMNARCRSTRPKSDDAVARVRT